MQLSQQPCYGLGSDDEIQLCVCIAFLAYATDWISPICIKALTPFRNVLSSPTNFTRESIQISSSRCCLRSAHQSFTYYIWHTFRPNRFDRCSSSCCRRFARSCSPTKTVYFNQTLVPWTAAVDIAVLQWRAIRKVPICELVKWIGLAAGRTHLLWVCNRFRKCQ